MKSVEVSAATREAAIQKGLEDLGLEMYEVDRIEIIDEGSKGLFGFGARPVKVRLVVENLQDAPVAESAEEAQDRGPRGDRGRRGGGRGRRGGSGQQSASDAVPQEARGPEREEAAPKADEAKPPREGGRGGRGRDGRRRGKRGGQDRVAQEGVEQRKDRDAPKADGEARRDRDAPKADGEARRDRPESRGEGRRERGGARRNDRPSRDRAEAAPQDLDAPRENTKDFVDPAVPPAPDEEETVIAITDEQGQEAAALVQELIEKMGMKSEVAFTRSEDGVARLDVSSEDSAILIGRKGQNLNAMQYLVNRIVSQHDTAENTERLVLDVEGYVDRRRATLQDMARSFARRVKDSGRSMRLKPLSPQERRIIHLTLQSDPDVRTYSLGEALFRSVVVSPANAEDEVPGPEERSRPPRRDRDRDSGTPRGGGQSRERSAPRTPVAVAIPSAEKTPKGDPNARKRGYGRFTFDEDIDVGQFGD